MIMKFFGWKRNGYRLEKENHDNLTAIGKGSQFLFLFNSQLQSLDSSRVDSSDFTSTRPFSFSFY